MTTVPRRLEKRQPHLNAHIVPVERALLARAGVLEQEAADPQPTPEGQPDRTPGLLVLVAAEFRALAEELHWR